MPTEPLLEPTATQQIMGAITVALVSIFGNQRYAKWRERKTNGKTGLDDVVKAIREEAEKTRGELSDTRGVIRTAAEAQGILCHANALLIADVKNEVVKGKVP